MGSFLSGVTGLSKFQTAWHRGEPKFEEFYGKKAYLEHESQAEKEVLVPRGLSWLSFGRGGWEGVQEESSCVSVRKLLPGTLRGLSENDTSPAARPSGLVLLECWEQGYFRCVKSDECWKVPSASLGTRTSHWQLRYARLFGSN